MRTTHLMLTLVSVSLMAQVTPQASSESKDEISGIDSIGARTLTTSRLTLDVTYPRGKKQERLELTVVHDPKGGYYLWHSINVNSDQLGNVGNRLKVMKERRVVVFAEPTSLVEFAFGDVLAASVWRRRAETADAAVSASIDEIRQGLALLEDGRSLKATKLVPFLDEKKVSGGKTPVEVRKMWQEFRCEDFNSFCPSTNNTIASITKQGSNWRLLLRNRFDVEVILDQNFDLISVTQSTLPPPEKPFTLPVFPKK